MSKGHLSDIVGYTDDWYEILELLTLLGEWNSIMIPLWDVLV